MAEYIKRTDVWDAVRLSRCDDCGRSICNYCPVASISVKIDNIPKADVRENVRGKWIPIKEKMLNGRTQCYEEVVTKYCCTQCGTVERYKWKFCRCGAVMENGSCRTVCTTL